MGLDRDCEHNREAGGREISFSVGLCMQCWEWGELPPAAGASYRLGFLPSRQWGFVKALGRRGHRTSRRTDADRLWVLLPVPSGELEGDGFFGGERKVVDQLRSRCPPNQLALAVSVRGSPAAATPPLPILPSLPLHSLSERVSYCEQSRGLGSSSQAWCWPLELPCGMAVGGEGVMTFVGSLMMSGL